VTTVEINAGINSMVTTRNIITKKVSDILAIPNTSNYHQDYGDLKNKVIKVKGSTIKDKTFYRYPNLSLPRNKVDLLKEKYNVSVTRSKAAADFKVVSPDTIRRLGDMFYSSINGFNDKATLMKYLNPLRGYFTDSAWSVMLEIADDINEDKWVSINVPYMYNTPFPIMYKAIRKIEYAKSCRSLSTLKDHDFIAIKDKDLIEDIFSSNNLVLDSDILEICNEDSIVIDAVQFENLIGMVKSDDLDDTSVALEIMAASNLTKSMGSIAYIFEFYLDHLKMGSNWNHISVKALRKATSKYHGYGSNDRSYKYSRFIKKIAEDDCLDEFIFKQVAKDIFDNIINRQFPGEASPFDFKISDIRLKDNYKELLKKPELQLEGMLDLPF
jgi:hypothetical protein